MVDQGHEVRAVVTGAASGLGRAIVTELVERGAQVVGVDLPGDDRAGAVAATGATFVSCDVSDQEAWVSAAREVERELGSVTLAVLNAGVMTRPPQAPIDDDPFDYIGTAAYRRVFAVNVDGVVFGLAALRRVLAPPANVLITASTAGLIGLAFDPFYAMTKHAVVGLVRSVAPPFGEQGIHVHAICPGGMDTAIVPAALRAAGTSALRPATEMARAIVEFGARTEAGGAWVLDRATGALVRYETPSPPRSS